MNSNSYSLPVETVLSRAGVFLDQCHAELNMMESLSARKADVEREILETGSYVHTIRELAHGCRMAWRNSNRCIGRLYWKSLKVIDAREINEPAHVFDALQSHLDLAFNNGQILSVITVFNPKADFQLLNHQLIRFAGHGNGIGDPAEEVFTKTCNQLGWVSTPKSNFDVLPWVLAKSDGTTVMNQPSIQPSMMVEIRHPELPFFADLGLKWYAVPVISDMILEIGGVVYPVAPFNGWYMGTEIGSRNFGDTNRYNMLPEIASRMGLDTSNSDSLWKDKALLELNRAVIHSFRSAGVAIENHHDASEQFMQFLRLEEQHGRESTGDWSWLVPPMSSSSSPIFHSELMNKVSGPNFFYRTHIPEAGRSGNVPTTKKGKCPFHFNSLK